MPVGFLPNSRQKNPSVNKKTEGENVSTSFAQDSPLREEKREMTFKHLYVRLENDGKVPIQVKILGFKLCTHLGNIHINGCGACATISFRAP